MSNEYRYTLPMTAEHQPRTPRIIRREYAPVPAVTMRIPDHSPSERYAPLRKQEIHSIPLSGDIFVASKPT